MTSLAERTRGLDPNDLRLEPIVVTPQLIIKNGGRYVVSGLKGNRWRIRSDFPLLIKADGQALGIAGPTTVVPHGVGPWRPAGPWLTLERNVGEFTFELYPGVTNSSPPTVSDYGAMHGHCVVEGYAGDQCLPVEADPDLLPMHSFILPVVFGGGVAGNTAALFTVSAFQPFNSGFSAIKEFFVKQLSVQRIVTATGVMSAAALHRAEIIKENNPAGDTHTLLAACGNSGAWTASFHNAKLPLYALFQQYAAEVPRLEVRVWGDADAANTTVNVILSGSYKI